MIRNLFALGAALVCCACTDGTEKAPPSRDEALAAISQEGIYAHLEYLAGDALEGRMTGEPGYALAAQYVADQLAAIGLEPGGTDGWYQAVPLQSYLINAETVSLTIHREGRDTQLTFVDDFIMGGDKVRAATRLSGELVYVGFGIHAPQFGYSDFADIDVGGKIAVAIYGGPSIIPSDELAHHSDNVSKAKELVARGAVGTLVLYPREMEESYPYEQLTVAYRSQPGMAWVDASGAAADFFPGAAWARVA